MSNPVNPSNPSLEDFFPPASAAELRGEAKANPVIVENRRKVTNVGWCRANIFREPFSSVKAQGGDEGDEAKKIKNDPAGSSASSADPRGTLPSPLAAATEAGNRPSSGAVTARNQLVTACLASLKETVKSLSSHEASTRRGNDYSTHLLFLTWDMQYDLEQLDLLLNLELGE